MSLRGEVTITVCGEELSLAPTYKAIEAIIRRLDKGPHALLNRFTGGDPRHTDMLVLVEEGLRGAGHLGANGSKPRFTTEQIADDIVDRFSEYLMPVLTLLVNFNGGAPKKADSQDEGSP